MSKSYKYLSLAAIAIGAVTMHSQILPAPTPVPASTITPSQSIRLWAAAAPGAKGDTPADIPTLDVYLPSQNPSRTAVMVCPGGGYRYLSLENEGSSIAAWLNAHGIAAFVLHYRVQYAQPAPLLDAERAMRIIRSRASSFNIQPDHIGVWGFSAGGHVASTLMTAFDSGLPSATAGDAIDAVSDRPDFGILAYPVISMHPGTAHPGSHDILLGTDATPELEQQFSSDLHVRPDSPSAFLFSTTDDQTVPIANTVLFYQAYVAAKAPVELHIFEHGRHGVGLAKNLPVLEHWPELVATWMTANGWMGTPTVSVPHL
jgi:acetyl esterase/lipase